MSNPLPYACRMDAFLADPITQMASLDSEEIRGLNINCGCWRCRDRDPECDACGEALKEEPQAEVGLKNGPPWIGGLIHQSCFNPETMEVA